MRRGALVALGVLILAPSGCVYAKAGYETFEWRVEPVAAQAEPPLSPTEIAYARSTARVLFRRRASERSADFVAADAGGYSLCLRSGKDLALLVFQRRVFEDAISQAADDVTIMRGPRDTAICGATRQWVPV